jgi:hypothetical protein
MDEELEYTYKKKDPNIRSGPWKDDRRDTRNVWLIGRNFKIDILG